LFKLGAKLGGRTKSKVRVRRPITGIDERYTVESVEALAEQFVVVGDAAPALAVIAICDVILGAGVAGFGIGTGKQVAGEDKIIRAEGGEGLGEKLFIDRVGSDRNLAFVREAIDSRAGLLRNFLERAGFGGIKKNYENAECNRKNHTDNLDIDFF